MIDDLTHAPDPRAALEARGASFKRRRSSQTNSMNLGGATVASSTVYTGLHTWTLPSDSGVRAGFAKEGLKSTVIKLFKEELQTGDAEFDDAVYITTDTEAATAAFLAHEDVRAVITDILMTGGSLSVDGETVTIGAVDDIDDEVAPDPAHEAVILGWLMHGAG